MFSPHVEAHVTEGMKLSHVGASVCPEGESSKATAQYYKMSLKSLKSLNHLKTTFRGKSFFLCYLDKGMVKGMVRVRK